MPRRTAGSARVPGRAMGGVAEVLGADPWREAVAPHRRIASVTGDVSVRPNLSGGESIDLLSRLRGASNRDPAHRRQRQRLIEALPFDPARRAGPTPRATGREWR